MRDSGMTIDASVYMARVNQLYRMGEIRRRDIADVFRKADKSLISLAKATVSRSAKGAADRAYESRSHKRGNLRKSVGFAVSKKYKLVYYARPKAWYRHIYSSGHGSFMGNPFMERSFFIKEQSIKRSIERGMIQLIQRTWKNG